MTRFHLPSFLVRTALVVVAAASAAPAQPRPGDILMSTNRGVYRFSPTSNSLNGFGTLAACYPVLMAHANRAAIVQETSSRRFLRIATDGTVATQSVLPRVSALALDQDRTYYAAGRDQILRLSTPLSTATTVATLQGAIGICRYLGNGDFYAVSLSGQLARYSPSTGTTTTIATLPTAGQPSGICYLPDVDRFAISQINNPASGLLITTPSGSVVRTISTPAAVHSVTYDAINRTIHAGTSLGQLLSYSNAGVLLRSRQFLGGAMVINGVEVLGDRNVSLSTDGTPGASATIFGVWESSPNQPVCFALSLGQRPGLFLSGSQRNQPIQPDRLFFITVCGGLPFFTTGFSGSTSSNGGSLAAFSVPIFAPPGTMFYVAGSAVNPAAPDGIELGNVAAVQVRSTPAAAPPGP